MKHPIWIIAASILTKCQARRQIVTCGVSSSKIPASSNSLRMRSASAKFFAFLAAMAIQRCGFTHQFWYMP
jgi:hypothetical protein